MALFEITDQISPVQAATLEVAANNNNFGVVSGCDITWNAALSLSIAAGKLLIDGAEVDLDAETIDITAQRPTGQNQRWVIITADADGLSQTAGVTAVNNPPTTYPLYPTIPTGHVLMAAVRLQSADTSLATLAAAGRALRQQVTAPTSRGLTGLDLNENGFVLAADVAPGTAWADLGSFSLKPTDTTDLVLLHLVLFLTIPNSSGRTISYRLLRGAGEILPEQIVPGPSYNGPRLGGPAINHPFLDTPASDQNQFYKVQTRRSDNSGTFTVHEGSFMHGREVHV